MVVKWEYRFLEVDPGEENTWSRLQEWCNIMGSDGWELVTVKDKYSIPCCVFKKPKE